MRPGEPCVHHIYRDPVAAPAGTWLRIGHAPPGGAIIDSGEEPSKENGQGD
jgi:hypothetical protein